MSDRFKDLRSTLYTTESERKHFRQLVVNTVMATDGCGAELRSLRNSRWEKAFGGSSGVSAEEALNRKATAVIEHLILASDSAPYMQHFHVYSKWTELSFRENMQAYKAGRAEKDPTEYWYKGELDFFDSLVIPLAKKLKESGVFGASSDEYLNNAENNRKEWELRGEGAVAEYAAKYLAAAVNEGDGDGDGKSVTSSSMGSTNLEMDEETMFDVTDSWELLRR